jgi:hypothetical protein
MKILRACKTELDLNNTQKTACARHAGAARWAYNWGLARKMEAYRKGEKVPTAIDLHRELNALKQGELSWMYALSKCAPQEALRNLDQAYAHIPVIIFWKSLHFDGFLFIISVRTSWVSPPSRTFAFYIGSWRDESFLNGFDTFSFNIGIIKIVIDQKGECPLERDPFTAIEPFLTDYIK